MTPVQFRTDVLAGLSRSQKRLPSKYFYDAAGSKLFDRITELDEYYPTRTELGILERAAGAMAARCGSRCLLIELGGGSLRKVRPLLDHLERPAGFVPVDVSGEHLRAAAKELINEYPALEVFPVVADFLRQFESPNIPAARRVVYFPGSTIGNFDPPEADGLLRRINRLVGPDGGLLLGIDLRKDTAILERAYNDAEGVTAEFNRNLLRRINRELQGDFEVQRFLHQAFFNSEKSRIEMHLVSECDQSVTIDDYAFEFREGETIHTENSYKYDRTEFARRCTACGFRTDEVWTDAKGHFAVLYLTALNPTPTGESR